MKETKVYVGRRNGKYAELMQRLDKALKEQHFAFVFTKQELKERDRELVKEVCEKIIKFINELAWKDVQYDAFQSTIGEFSGSTSAIPRYAKKYFDLWKYMFGEDLNKKE